MGLVSRGGGWTRLLHDEETACIYREERKWCLPSERYTTSVPCYTKTFLILNSWFTLLQQRKCKVHKKQESILPLVWEWIPTTGLATGRWQQMSARTTEKQTPCSSGAGHWRKPPEYICIFRENEKEKIPIELTNYWIHSITLKDNSYICTFVLLDRMEWDILFSVVGK